MLVLGRQSSISAAQTLQSQISDAGGSGYIINNGEFLITAFVYTNKSDADSVLQRVKSSYAAAEIVMYQIPATKIKRFGDRDSEKQLKELLNYPLEFVDTIIKYVYSLDSFESSESEVMLKLQTDNSVLKSKTEMLNEYNLPAADLKTAKESALVVAAIANFSLLFYSEICQTLEGITQIASLQGKLTHHLKSIACEIVHKYYVLRLRLNGL